MDHEYNIQDGRLPIRSSRLKYIFEMIPQVFVSILRSQSLAGHSISPKSQNVPTIYPRRQKQGNGHDLISLMMEAGSSQPRLLATKN
jgi:hypothetical protein